jgi:hypothetical protein
VAQVGVVLTQQSHRVQVLDRELANDHGWITSRSG